MKRHYYIVGLIFLIFFAISLLTNILGPLIPDMIRGFGLSLGMASFLPFSFFIAYGVMSIPAGMMVERFKEKPVIVLSFTLAFVASLLFVLLPRYTVALISLFLIGLGMAMLQVAINPLLRTSGGEEHFAFYSVMAQLFFGAASFISPHIYAYLVQKIPASAAHRPAFVGWLSGHVPPGLPWVSLYWLFALVTLVLIVWILFSRFPKVELKEDEKTGSWEVYRRLFKKKTVLLFFMAVFAYVGTEQGTANWISQFLRMYHGYNPQVEGARAVSYFWGLMTAGCFLGLFLLKVFDSRRILLVFTVLAMISLACALFGPGPVALFSFPLVGFFASVMWSIIFSLALNSLTEHHGSFSGILCTAIIGGALVPLLIGWLGDWLGLRLAMLILFVTLGYIFTIGLWAKPLINNSVIRLKKERRHVKTLIQES